MCSKTLCPSGDVALPPTATGRRLVTPALLSWYLANFADYDATYGCVRAAIGLMMRLWISSIVILFGAELNSEIEHQTARDSTVGRDKPLGARGAAMRTPSVVRVKVDNVLRLKQPNQVLAP
jgi:Virulence factor BrkB